MYCPTAYSVLAIPYWIASVLNSGVALGACSHQFQLLLCCIDLEFVCRSG